MGTETRIGILTGLVIVVIASVYFFYGSDSPDEDFLIATGNQVSQPPKIPLSSEQKALSPNTGGEADALRRVADNATRQPVSRETEGVPGHSRQRKVAPRRLADARRGRADLSPMAPSRSASPSVHDASPGTGATPLRTGPSQDLIDATRRNVEDAEQDNTNEQTAIGEDGTSRKSDIARIVERLRKNRAGESTNADDARETQDRSTQQPTESTTPQPTATGNNRSDRRATHHAQPAARPTPQRRHKIVRNDTLEGIALRYYNDRRRIDDIVRANPGINPRRLKIGDEIILPPDQPQPTTETTTVASDTATGNRADARERVERTVSTRTHTVRENESFYSIARSQLGSGARWKELFELNREVVKNNPRGLKPGMVLRLPN